MHFYIFGNVRFRIFADVNSASLLNNQNVVIARAAFLATGISQLTIYLPDN